MFDDLKIISLRAENFQRLTAVEITPTGNLVEITGKNSQGKSSTLDAIWAAIAGADAIPGVPIRKGENEALIELDLGKIIVKRTFVERTPTEKDPTPYTTSLIVESQEGARFPKPQTMIDGLIDALSFDPLAFTQEKPSAQFEMLRAFVPGIDFDEIARLQRGDYERRRDVNKVARDARTRAEGIRLPAETPVPVDLDALTERLRLAGETNTQRETERHRRDTLKREAENQRIEIGNIDVDIAGWREKIRLAEFRRGEILAACELAENYLAAAEPVPSPVDTSEIARSMAEGRELNARVERILADRKERDRLIAAAAAAEQESADLTDAMEQREAAKQEAIAKAKLPVSGLSFGQDEKGNGIVLMNGVPFAQAATSEQIRTGVAIAAAMNKGLRVIRIKQAAFLDDDGMAELARFADEANMQVWAETISAGGRVAVEIRDGAVVGQEITPREKKARKAGPSEWTESKDGVWQLGKTFVRRIGSSDRWRAYFATGYESEGPLDELKRHVEESAASIEKMKRADTRHGPATIWSAPVEGEPMAAAPTPNPDPVTLF